MTVDKSTQTKYTVEYAPGRRIEAHVQDGVFHSMYHIHDQIVALPVRHLAKFIEALNQIEDKVVGLPIPEWR